AALEIEVLPPFYFSKLAIFLYTLVFILLFALSLRYYHYRVQRKNNRKIKAFQDEKEKEIYQSKIEFFTNVAHEIRTPLTLIKTPLEKLIGQTKDQPIMQKSLSIMEKNTERLINLVNELLDFRKTEIENIKLTFVEINISETLRNTYTRFSELIQEKAVDFRMKLPQEEVMAFVDEEAIKKIMSNLFNNAIKYAKNEVILKLEVTDSEFILKVQNDGSLIPQHLKKRIFEPFFRTDEVSNQTGTGIGLSLAYSLTELHSGQLILANEDTHLNTFILKLPLRQEQEFNSYKKEPKVIERQQEEIPQEEIINDTAENSGILIVEDNRELLKFIADDFKEEYAVFKSTNAETAIEILKKENIYLIISDVMMNGMDGFEFCEYVKTNLETSHIPVILLTAKNAMQSKIQGLEAGADAYIEKPFSLEYLKVQVSNLIENRRHIMEFYSSSPLSHIKSIAHTKTDERFINKLEKLIYDNLSDQNLNVDSLADIMNMSRSTLYRKIKDLSNLSPNELINIARLKKAAELLQSGEYKIYEISEIVGYKSQTSFGRNFQKQFKMTPSEYMNGKQPIEE
ncbi:hybrid sensor histidine kinase/response regulator transcription factor, partial [Zunongwangia profunda]